MKLKNYLENKIGSLEKSQKENIESMEKIAKCNEYCQTEIGKTNKLLTKLDEEVLNIDIEIDYMRGL